MNPAGLPPSVGREHIHTRRVVSQGYLRADGLWDIEAGIEDTKTYFARNGDGRERQPGEPIHHMLVRLTLDDALKVIDAVAAMPNTPFDECGPAADPVRGLMAMATVAYQTIPNYRIYQRRQRGEPRVAGGKPGHQLGKCLGWDTDGPVVARIAPEFIGYQLPPRR